MASAPRAKNGNGAPPGRRLIAVIVGSFALIAAGFLASTAYSELQASSIDDDVTAIETNSLPSVEHLTFAAAALHRFEVEASRYATRPQLDGENERSHVYEARREVDRALMAYLETPMYPGERSLFDRVTRSLDALDRALAELYDLTAKDPAAARSFSDTGMRPAIDDTEHALRSLMALNTSHLHAEVTQIAVARKRTIQVALALDSLCVLFSVCAAILAVRALRRRWALERVHEQMLEVRASELEMFAKRVAHDLLGPLSALSFTLSSLKRNADRGVSIADPLARANACLMRSRLLVDGILDFARAGTAPSVAGNADVREAIDGVIDEARTDETSRVEIVLEPFDDVRAACAPGVLTSILSNLVRNAVKYMGDRPERRITVRVTSDDTRARVEVEDTGPGLSPDVEANVFEPYMRARENSQPGLGLGLSTVRRFVEGHGGRVGVHSFPGRGCVFWFELPRADASQPSAKPPESTTPLLN